MPNLLPDSIEQYIADYTSPETPALAKLNRSTYLKAMMPQMLSGHVQGRVLSMLSHMIRPKRILEIGTFTGYSAICLAEGLAPEGLLTTIDINEELTPMVKEAVTAAGMQHKIEIRTGNALEIIPTLPGTFDLVFIDADKQNYQKYFDLVLPKTPIGGYILADNVLWSGKVTNPKHDKDTAAIHAFNQYVANHPQVEQVILSVRDGITLCRKIG
ncbi:MAG TPA: O-methyltransferase [Chitinophagales bacterium]|nr:O-methyltransferase [Chitinophagales bacterium]